MMTRLINEIKDALMHTTSSQDLLSNLKDSDFIFKANHPIALIHSASRLDNIQDQQLFKEQGLLDENGYTPTQPSAKHLDFLAQHKPQYIKNVNIMCMREESKEPLSFVNKLPNDYWKKIQNVQHIVSMFEISDFDDQTTICQAEFELREIMRKRKEVHALKDVGFIWMCTCSQDLKELFTHYFGDNYVLLKTNAGTYQLGWSNTLREISLRNFVCPPK